MVDRDRLRDELTRMRELIASDPAVLARFDTDGNGIIDGDEWEAVRQLVVKRLEREEQEAAAASALQAQLGAEAGPDDLGEDLPLVVGSTAEDIYSHELAPVSVEGGPLVQRNEIMLKEEILGNVLGGLVKRNYELLGADGASFGSVHQHESDFMASLKSGGWLAEVGFDVIDAVGQERMTFRHQPRLGTDYVSMESDRGIPLGQVSIRPGLLSSSYRISTTYEGHPITVKKVLRRPWTMTILDAFDDPIGEIQRGWSGLGAFFTGVNLTRIRIDNDAVPPPFRWGLVAVAVLEDVWRDKHKKRDGIDVMDLLSG